MDGRLTLNTTLSEFEKLSGLKITAEDVKKYIADPKFNISPSHDLAVTTNHKVSEASILKWGLIPAWTNVSKTTKGLSGISTQAFGNKPVLQLALAKKRCLIWS